MKYSVTHHFDVFGAWYEYTQNNYNPKALCPAGQAAASTCSGRLQAYSLVARLPIQPALRRAIGGAMRSHVADSLASGYLSTVSIDPTIGGRFTF